MSVTVSVIVSGTAVTLGRWVDPGSGWATQLVHLALTLPVAAGAAYASKISSRHRAQAWWADTTAAQLHTFTAFSTPLSEDARWRLREQFGVRIFTLAAFNTQERGDDSAALTAAVSDALDAVRGKQEGSA